MEVKNNSYFITYQWMVSELGLKGTALGVYAIIFAFTISKRGKFYGTLNYLADRLGSTKNNIFRVITKLCSKNKNGESLLIKETEFINGNKYCYYRVALNRIKQEYLDQVILIESL